VPASSEIVIEGHVMLDQVDSEGPMAEFPGHLFKEHYRCPVFKVTAITHRNDAICPSYPAACRRRRIIPAGASTKSVLNCLPHESWMAETGPVRASFDQLYPAELQARIVRDWKTVYGLR
jgi:UbiD family decarboxylase